MSGRIADYLALRQRANDQKKEDQKVSTNHAAKVLKPCAKGLKP